MSAMGAARDEPSLYMKPRRELLTYDELKNKCYAAFRKRLKEGKLFKPTQCGRCNRTVPPKNLHGHHSNYNRPGDVLWLCPACHRAAHKLIELFRRSRAFLEYCAKEKIHPKDATVLPILNPRTGRPRKITWYQHWRSHDWPRADRIEKSLKFLRG